jgi:hypothetical protein
MVRGMTDAYTKTDQGWYPKLAQHHGRAISPAQCKRQCRSDAAVL